MEQLTSDQTLTQKNDSLVVNSSDIPVLKFGPDQKAGKWQFKELWHFRELLYFLAWRDVKVRYKQTALGAAWAIIQPFFTMVVFTIFFGKLAKIPSDGIPYPIFSYTALLPWQLFASSLTLSSNSLVSSSNLITKVYFPRLIVPMASLVVALVDFCIAFVVLLGMMVYYQVVPTYNVIFLPLFIFFGIFTAFSVGLWLSGLNVKYRDVRYAMSFLIQFWLFASPVAYSSSLLPEKWRWLYGLNPMAGVIEGFRWAVLGREMPIGGILTISVPLVIVLFIGGLWYFKRTEKTFADIV